MFYFRSRPEMFSTNSLEKISRLANTFKRYLFFNVAVNNLLNNICTSHFNFRFWSSDSENRSYFFRFFLINVCYCFLENSIFNTNATSENIRYLIISSVIMLFSLLLLNILLIPSQILES